MQAWERDVPGSGAAKADQSLIPFGGKHVAGQVACHRGRIRACALAERDFQEPARVRLWRTDRARQSTTDGGVRATVLSVAACAARAGRPRAGDRARGRRSRRAHRCRGSRRPIRHRLCLDDRRRRGAGIEGARRVARSLRGEEPPARRRAELHGGVFLPRAPDRLSQHRALPARARLGRMPVPIRRHHPVLDEVRGRARVALLLLRHVRQRARPRPRRLPQLRHRRSRDAAGRAVHRRHPPAGGVHARGRSRACHGQACPRHQDRRDRAVAGRLAVPHRRDRRRLRRLSRDVRALRHRQLSLARRPGRSRARVRGRTAAEGAAHRLRHHLGRNRRPAVRLCRGRRRGDARLHRRHQGRAPAHDAGRHRAEKSARRRHSLHPRSRRQDLRDRGAAIPISTWWPGPRPCRARPMPGAT